MREVRRSAITPYSAEEMFALVTDIDSYSSFLPWCNESAVQSSSNAAGNNDSETEVVATLGIAQGPLQAAFTTKNLNVRPSRVDMKLVDGPFSDLQGVWTITPLGEVGSKLELSVQFAFDNPLKDKLLGAVFEQTCNRLVDAFVTRAGQVYAR